MTGPLLHVALLEPKIPQNTGNIGRLTLAMGARLHLVGQLGFRTDAHACRRAGLDYWKHVDVQEHRDLETWRAALPAGTRVFAFSTRAAARYSDVAYRRGDCFLFGDEPRGLPDVLLGEPWVQPLRIPLRSPRVRSLNLANAAAIAVAEAVRQLGHPDETPPRVPEPEESACART